MDYGKILGRAWEITWRWKVLWILGFLASLGQGGWGGNGASYSGGSQDIQRWGWQMPNEEVVAGIIGIIVALACLAFLIGIALWVVSVIARGGLIAGVQQVEEEGETSFLSAWRVGVHRFWTLFGISFLAAIPIIVLVIVSIVVGGLLIAGTVGAIDQAAEVGGVLGGLSLALCGGTFCCGGILLAAVLAQIQIYAERAAILEGLGWIDAFKRGWDVLKNNLGPTILFWLIFVVIGLIFGVLILGVLGGASVPFIALFANTDPGPWILAPICIGGLLFIIIAALINSVVTTFTSATWTLAYREMTGLTGTTVEPIVEPAPEPAPEHEPEA
jgi:hypothetical protein